MTTDSISPYADTLYSLDIIERIKELQDIPSDERTSDEERELTALLLLEEDASDSPDWKYGETLINDAYFKEYAMELAEDCGMIPDVLRWPVSCIDWNQAADELKMDYIDVGFMGFTFWIRG